MAQNSSLYEGALHSTTENSLRLMQSPAGGAGQGLCGKQIDRVWVGQYHPVSHTASTVKNA